MPASRSLSRCSSSPIGKRVFTDVCTVSLRRSRFSLLLLKRGFRGLRAAFSVTLDSPKVTQTARSEKNLSYASHFFRAAEAHTQQNVCQCSDFLLTNKRYLPRLARQTTQIGGSAKDFYVNCVEYKKEPPRLGRMLRSIAEYSTMSGAFFVSFGACQKKLASAEAKYSESNIF